MMSGRRASKLWKFFNPDVNSKLATCIICDRTVSYKSTTSNLKSHIRRVHPYQFSEFLTSESTTEQWISQDSNDSLELNSFTYEIEQNTPQSSTSSRSNAQATQISIKHEQLEDADENRKELVSNTTPKKPALVERKSKIDRSLIKLFTRDFQPLTIVEDEGFKEYTNALNPTYQLPTCKMISRKILPNMYNKCLKTIREYIQLEAKNVCVTTDCWTSNTDESYVALTVHFLTDDLELMSVLLDCAQFMGPQSVRQLADELQNILVDWDLQDKVILAVTDDTSNLKDALECHLQYEHFVCYAHSLNVIVQDALKLFEVTFTKIKHIVMHFDKCPSSAENLNDYQLSSNACNSAKQLIQSVTSRWNSSYHMLKRFVELEECISASMDMVGSDLPIITGEESEACRQLCTVLQPFDEVIQATQSEKYLSGSMPIVLTKALLIVCEKLSNQPFYETIVNIIKKLTEGIKDYFGSLEQNDILSLCTFLDPRFKTHYYCEADTVESVKRYIRRLFLTELDSNQCKAEPTSSSLRQNQVISVWSVVDSVVENIKPTKGQTNASKANMEIDLYLESNLLPREDCPLMWWKENKWKFPNLAKIFKMKCGVVTTSVPCEMLFSDKGRILNDRRSSLKAQDVRKIVFLNANDFQFHTM